MGVIVTTETGNFFKGDATSRRYKFYKITQIILDTIPGYRKN